MAFNFSGLNPNPCNTVIHPREIFSVLPNKHAQFQYPRDVQTDVWNKWYARRSSKDNVIRMNTGSGKTVVALLMLQSSLNEGIGPAVYITPDQYLAQQAFREAQELGIDATLDKDSIRFLKGREILITTIKTLVNGQSVFGVGTAGIKKEIGSIVIDDAHACLESIESQFTLVLNGQAHDQLLSQFLPDLKQQSETTALEIEQHQPDRYALVPFWAWQNKITTVIKLIQSIASPSAPGGIDLYTEESRDAVRFNYPLIKDCISLCRCVFGGGKAEISPSIIPISVIPSFANAKRRIFLSATLAEDGVLVSHFDINPASITNAITPDSASDIGDRMIIIPQELNTSYSDDELKALYKRLSAQRNVVVIVPSNFRAQYWSDVADLTLRADNMDSGVARLQKEKVGLIVFVNKYDGIDLPKSACEVLVIDSLPDVRRGIDKVEDSILFGTDQLLSKKIQRIEQGMGRGIRSNDDYSLVFLMGKTLTNFLYKAGAKNMFSVATRAQLVLSEQTTEGLIDRPIEELEELAHEFLSRNKDWVAASKGALVRLKYESTEGAGLVVRKQREAFECASRSDFPAAMQRMEEAANQTLEDKVKGWLKLQVASYAHRVNPVTAQEVLRSATALNSRITRPMSGVAYSPLARSKTTQGHRSKERLVQFGNATAMRMEVESVLSQLVFQPETSNAFEEAVKDLGLILGFGSQRPENEFGRGPDVLWELGDGTYIVIECKNGVTSDNPINKHDCNQLNGSMIWFSEKYGATATALPLMIHSQTTYEHAATLPECARILTPEKLDELRVDVRRFADAVHTVLDEPSRVQALLVEMKLLPRDLPRFFAKTRRKTA